MRSKREVQREVEKPAPRVGVAGEQAGLDANLRPTHDLHVKGTRPLVEPTRLHELLPITEASRRAVLEGRDTIGAILAGKDPRFLVVLGPCSIHDVDAALEYAKRLVALKCQYQDRMYLVMRTYFEKPRTTVGWKGLINDPHLDGSFDMETGLTMARKLLMDVTTLGLAAGSEMLEPITPQYIDDVLSWASIGARTTESQTHRQMASGLSMPVGFKNATDGSLTAAINAMKSARAPHHFLGIDKRGHAAVIETTGNETGHLVLRGGEEQPNYDPVSVAEAVRRLREAGLPPLLMVDCSHANSGKVHAQQEVVWRSIIDQRAAGDASLIGAMLESHLVEGKQDIPADRSALRYGVSVTDACIGWEQTEEILEEGYRRLSA